MGDPKQTDLEEFLAGGAARAASQPLASLGSAEVMRLCVQIEHTGAASLVENAEVDPEPNAAEAPMAPRRLLVCLAVIGWSGHELARRTGRPQTTVRRWTTGETPMPADVAAWVETLAACHRAHPAPRARQGLPG